MHELFELDWLGGPAEKYFRKIRPGTDELPWGSLNLAAMSAAQLDRARVMWTTMARQEYFTAINFAQLLQHMLVARCPIDLVGMAGDFLADEMRHVELCARVASELGGAAPQLVDLAQVAIVLDSALSPLQQVSDLMIRVCCVGEAFSVPMLVATYQAADAPLLRAALELIVREEAGHARLGSLFLDWRSQDTATFDDTERQRLGQIATAQLNMLAPYWQPKPGTVNAIHLGELTGGNYAAIARQAALTDVVAPLRSFGIEIDTAACGLDTL